MKALDSNRPDPLEASSSEHERWTSAIMRALHELRSASASGLDKHFECDDDGDGLLVSPRAGTVPPPGQRTTH